MPQVLLVKTSSLGDIVHMFPAVTDMQKAVPGLQLDWVVEEGFVPLARLHPAPRDILPVATRRWRRALTSSATWREAAAFRATLRARRYDLVIDANGLIRSALITRLATGTRHGYDRDSIREPLASRFYDVTHAIGRALHAIERNRRLAAASLGYALTGAADYGLARATPKAASRRVILFHGTAQPRKRWPDADWIATGRALAADGWTVLLPGGSDEELERSRRLASEIPGAQPLPRMKLDAMADVIAETSLAIGCDTGLLHLAAALSVPLVAIFVASDPDLTAPVSNAPMTVLGRRGAPPDAAQVIAAARALPSP